MHRRQLIHVQHDLCRAGGGAQRAPHVAGVGAPRQLLHPVLVSAYAFGGGHLEGECGWVSTLEQHTRVHCSGGSTVREPAHGAHAALSRACPRQVCKGHLGSGHERQHLAVQLPRQRGAPPQPALCVAPLLAKQPLHLWRLAVLQPAAGAAAGASGLDWQAAVAAAAAERDAGCIAPVFIPPLLGAAGALGGPGGRPGLRGRLARSPVEQGARCGA